RDDGRLERGHRSPHDIRESLGQVQQRPKVITCFPRQQPAEALARELSKIRLSHFYSGVCQLAEDRVRSHNRVLNVWSCFAVKRQCLFEIESDDRVARVFQQEIAQRSDRDLVCNVSLFQLTQVRMAAGDFGQSIGFELVDEIIDLYAQPFTPGHTNGSSLAVFLGDWLTELLRG